MYTVIISLAFVAVLFIVLRRRYLESALYDGFVASILSAFAFVMIVAGVVEALTYLAPSKDETVEIKLASMRTSEAISGSFAGSFIVASGSISSSMVYQVYLQNADGSVTPHRIAANSKLRILEDKDLHGVGYWKQTLTRKDLSAVRNWVVGTAPAADLVSNELRVPVGTVLHSFAAQ